MGAYRGLDAILVARRALPSLGLPPCRSSRVSRAAGSEVAGGAARQVALPLSGTARGGTPEEPVTTPGAK